MRNGIPGLLYFHNWFRRSRDRAPSESREQGLPDWALAAFIALFTVLILGAFFNYYAHWGWR